MPSSMRKSRVPCVYCDSRKSLTRDHVPPKCLFSNPLPQDLITVPCCRQCNKSASKDDEYFRMILAGRRDVGGNPDASIAMGKAVRALQRPEAKGFRRFFLDSTRFFYFVNELGVVEPGGSYDADHNRLGHVASRIIRGLFWNQTGERLPNDCEVITWVDEGLKHVDRRRLQMFAQVMTGEPLSAIGRVFRHWYQPVPEDRFTGVWILQFYENIHFYCLTINPHAKPALSAPS